MVVAGDGGQMARHEVARFRPTAKNNAKCAHNYDRPTQQ